jgi:hypothetical protein
MFTRSQQQKKFGCQGKNLEQFAFNITAPRQQYIRSSHIAAAQAVFPVTVVTHL